MFSLIVRSTIVTIVMFVILCGLYPLSVTLLAQAAFPFRANGSLVEDSGKVIGSELIEQGFSKPEYFHGRPSAAGEKGYDAANSSGSNLGPTSKKLADAVKGNIDQVIKDNPTMSKGQIPVDMVTASGSGLDPHISPEAALLQVERVAKARNADPEKIKGMIAGITVGRTWGILGEERVNVLLLNRWLDKEAPIGK